jgi:hypothetical protein
MPPAKTNPPKTKDKDNKFKERVNCIIEHSFLFTGCIEIVYSHFLQIVVSYYNQEVNHKFYTLFSVVFFLNYQTYRKIDSHSLHNTRLQKAILEVNQFTVLFSRSFT